MTFDALKHENKKSPNPHPASMHNSIALQSVYAIIFIILYKYSVKYVCCLTKVAYNVMSMCNNIFLLYYASHM